MKLKHVLIGVCAVIVVTGLISFVILNSPVSAEPTVFTLYITEDDTFADISHTLEEEGMIRLASFMQFVLRFKLDKTLVSGIFEVDGSWTTMQIIDHLSDPDNVIPNAITIRLPEGGWAIDFARLLEDNTDLTSTEILEAWNDPDYIRTLIEDYPFLEGVPELTDTFILLEGYLYPDTYEFQRFTTVDFVTRKILDRTYDILEPLSHLIDQSGFSIHELMTLASIVNYEGNDETSMRMIADVFMNRLDINMTLGSSVTVCYALQSYENWQECEANTDIDSPYNTYIHTGLPPGPIMNPTEVAIRAVINPIETNYYFFVADVSTGEIHFARTYAEHLINVETYVDPYR